MATAARIEVERMAADAAAAAGVRVELLDSPASAAAVAELFVDVWQTTGDHAPISPDLLCALSLAGAYISMVRSEGRVVAASVGFLAAHGAELRLHSHITGVRRSAQGAHIGYALKLHQRAWAARQGLSAIEWTFDPLIRRNAHFNLAKLGALPARYIVDAYGDMADAVNAGDPSDRFLVEWHVASAVPRRADRSGAAVVLSEGPDGGPVPTPPETGRTRAAWIPEDIVALRRSDPPLARRWRLALRDALTAAAADGYAATAITRDGWYVLERVR